MRRPYKTVGAGGIRPGLAVSTTVGVHFYCEQGIWSRGQSDRGDDPDLL